MYDYFTREQERKAGFDSELITNKRWEREQHKQEMRRERLLIGG